MKKKYNSILNIILPHKKINILILSIIIIGVTIGAIYSNMISINDQNLVIDKIKTFINNINNNSLNGILVFRNSISINLIYILLIWILGFTLLGAIIGIIFLLIKSFIVGFSIASFIVTYKYKGIIISLLYIIFGQIINIFVILITSIYAITFAIKLLKIIFKKNSQSEDMKKFLKHYFIILIISLVLIIISSLCESFILPAIIKLIIKIYV